MLPSPHLPQSLAHHPRVIPKTALSDSYGRITRV
jgi:hypothetical protein